MQFQDAKPGDAALIASMHIDSWRSAYAQILDPAYLAGPIEADRLAIWTRRLAEPEAQQRIIIAQVEGEAVGFTCLIGQSDPRWGMLVDNLHALPSAKGKGVGSALMGQAARWSIEYWPDEGMHLFCYAENVAARGFYAHRGGEVVEAMEKAGPDGRTQPELRFYWRDPAVLAI